MKYASWMISTAGLMALAVGSAPNAFATACPNAGNPCTIADGQTFTPEDVVEISGSLGLTAIATFTTANQSNSEIETDVEEYLGDLGVTGTTYLGRGGANGVNSGPGDSGPSGTSITLTGYGGSSGTWSFSPGTTGDTASYLAIHAGGGQNDTLYEFNTPDSLSGDWNTAGNNDAGLSNFDLFGGTGGRVTIPGGGGVVPEPATLTLLGAGLAGVSLLRRRTRK